MKTDELNKKLYKRKEKPKQKIDWGLSLMTFIENHVITFMVFLLGFLFAIFYGLTCVSDETWKAIGNAIKWTFNFFWWVPVVCFIISAIYKFRGSIQYKRR